MQDQNAIHIRAGIIILHCGSKQTFNVREFLKFLRSRRRERRRKQASRLVDGVDAGERRYR
jgi:hypothetical protein